MVGTVSQDVGRILEELSNEALVARDGEMWRLTEAGKQEAERLELEFRELKEELARSMRRMNEKWERPLTSITQGIRSAVLRTSTKPLLEAFDVRRLILPAATSWLAPFERARRVEKAFGSVGLVPGPSMDEGFVERIVATHENGADPEEICRDVLDYYDANGAAVLADVIERLVSNPYFADREKTLRQTFEAHRQGYDAITVYPLALMIEGVLVPYLREALDKKKIKHNELADHLGHMPFLGGIGLEGPACLIGFMEAHLYDWWNLAEGEDERVDEHMALNRHRLAHGALAQGTRMDTLRCFLILDLIAALLKAWDALGHAQEENI